MISSVVKLRDNDFQIARVVGRGSTCEVFSAWRHEDVSSPAPSLPSGEETRPSEIILKVVECGVTAMREIEVLVYLSVKWAGFSEGEKGHFSWTGLAPFLPLWAWSVHESSGRALLAFDSANYAPLSHVLRSEPEVLGGPLDLAKQLLGAVAFLHSLDMVHGDIKPSNVLVGGEAGHKIFRLTDFGTAQFITDIKAGEEYTTLAYRAPEAHQGLLWGPPADLWAIGCVLFEVVVGEQFFGMKSLATQRYLNMDMDVRRLLDRLLSFEPADRGSAAQIVLEIASSSSSSS